MTNKPVKKHSGLMGKILFPSILLLLIVGFIYWGTDASNQTSENPVAKGVAKFYAEVRKAIKPGGSRLDDFTIELPKSPRNATELLELRRDEVSPGSPVWEGENKKRSFKENETIKTVLERFAQEEGVAVIWDLKYDYIIKQHFTESGNLKSLVDSISKVVAGDYGGHVDSVYCPKERTIVLTTNKTEYMSSSCVLTLSSAQLRRDQEMEKKYRQERRELGN
ncbi:TcpQ domain-containing protein [Psychrosphaera sp. 1_MG-2023]|uniref:TcpQ domain-containing protein n=1 Tax=Psychrosphaera sp. 1_MG-2023 TaxID=3062643 RepID=UPI0026E1AF65|nr:TcpQ domain-containing protein [Psychrosphaera sp. 1_MG-2023]MDO6718619.1 TcpQ domain-containing protein [Psychrosphaera sp. 1_MG-2023]